MSKRTVPLQEWVDLLREAPRDEALELAKWLCDEIEEDTQDAHLFWLFVSFGAGIFASWLFS